MATDPDRPGGRIPEGTVEQRSWPVTEAMTAEHHGNPGFPVLATPVLVELMEATASASMGRFLDGAQGSVGLRVDIHHTAPTPVGRTVTVTARVVGQEGRTVHFEIEARDDAGPVASARHDRVVVLRERFERWRHGGG